MTERSRAYKEYIQSDKWQETRKRFFRSKLWKRQGKTCYCCENERKVDIHHKTYKTFGNENLNHLVAICRSCHNDVHDLVKLGAGLWKSAKKIRHVKLNKRSLSTTHKIIKNQKRSKLRKKKKRKKDKGWFEGLNKKDRNLLKMELSLRDRGIKY